MRPLFLFFTLFLAHSTLAEIKPEWTTPLAPFQIADTLYYVGSQDLAVYLVTTRAGNILVNANLETSPPQIRASIRAIGSPALGRNPEELGVPPADTAPLLKAYQ
jgi:metallo-beta-lactamase class B